MPRGSGGGFGRGFGRGGFGRGMGMRRYGAPLMRPMGGWGMGGGYGSPLLTSLLAGGVGYALGNNNAQQNQPPAYQPYPYPTQAPPQAAPDANSAKLAQLKLLGDLHNSGILTNDEFENQKQRILNS